jgi:hypothetical protein
VIWVEKTIKKLENIENLILKALLVKKLRFVCEDILNGLIIEGAAVILEKLGTNVVHAKLKLFIS